MFAVLECGLRAYGLASFLGAMFLRPKFEVSCRSVSAVYAPVVRCRFLVLRTYPLGACFLLCMSLPAAVRTRAFIIGTDFRRARGAVTTAVGSESFSVFRLMRDVRSCTIHFELSACTFDIFYCYTAALQSPTYAISASGLYISLHSSGGCQLYSEISSKSIVLTLACHRDVL